MKPQYLLLPPPFVCESFPLKWKDNSPTHSTIPESGAHVLTGSVARVAGVKAWALTVLRTPALLPVLNSTIKWMSSSFRNYSAWLYWEEEQRCSVSPMEGAGSNTEHVFKQSWSKCGQTHHQPLNSSLSHGMIWQVLRTPGDHFLGDKFPLWLAPGSVFSFSTRRM